MRKEAAGCALAILMVVASSLVTACGQSGAVKQVVSSVTARSTAAPAHSPAGAAGPSQAGTVASPGQAAAAGTPAPAATATPAASSATPGWFWLWIALALLVVAIITALFIRMRHRHAASAADRQTRLILAYAKGAALHDAMAVAETPEVFCASDAGVRWADIRRRADDFGQLLYSLRESARDDQERVAFTDVLAASRSAMSAMAAERSAGGGTNDLIAEMVRDRLSSFGLSLRWLRNPHARPARVTDDPSGTADSDPLGWPES